MKTHYVLDTCALFPKKGKNYAHWQVADFEKGIHSLTEIGALFTQGIVSCVPQMLEELEASRQVIEKALMRIGEGSVSDAFYTRFIRTYALCQENLYDWQKETGLKQTIGKYAHHWTRRHNQHLDKNRMGGRLETDKHIMTATIVRGLEGEGCLVTRDHDLKESFKGVLIDVIQGGGLQEHFPRVFTIYHFGSDRTKPLTKGEPHHLGQFQSR